MDSINAEKQPSHNAEIIDRGLEDLGPGERIPSLNEPPWEPPEDIPPSGRASWKQFTTRESVIKGLNVTLGMCFTISMSLDLKNNWNNYARVGKALNGLPSRV